MARNNILLVVSIGLLIIQACKNNDEKYFTGTIEYAYNYTSDSLNADSLAKLRPSKSDFRYDTDNYQSRFIVKDTETYYYSGAINKCIGETNNQKNYSCEDYSVMTDSVVSFKVYDTDEKVLGYACRIIEIQKKGSWVQYYISRDLIIAPSTYQKHKSYNWDFYGEKSNGGLILKSEHRFKHFTMKGMVTQVKKHSGNFKALQISDTLFASVCK